MSSKQFTAQTFAWLRLLKSDRDMTAVAVGMQLTEHFNEKDGGRAWAGCGYMAKALGLNEATVIRAVHRMHARGRLRVEWGKQGRGHSNQYWMIVKPAPAQVLDPEKPTPASAVKPAPASRKPAPAHMNHLKNHVEGAKAPSTKGRESGSLALTVIPAAAPAVGGAPEEGRALIEDRFVELLAIWQRPWGEDEAAAHRAFAMACREADPGRYSTESAIPDEIIAAAHAWVAAADAPRFLKPLATWLSKGLWKKPPPQRRPKRNGKVSLSNLALEIGGRS